MSLNDSMNIMQLSFTDIVGRIFNGYDLIQSLNSIDHESANMTVWKRFQAI